MADIRYVDVWQHDHPSVRADAMALWQETRTVPDAGEREERAASLCVVAYDGDHLIGVSTIALRTMDAVRSRVGYLRTLVLPGHRQQNVATEIAGRSRDALEAWSLKNPSEQLKGMAAHIQSPELSGKCSQPIWPRTGLTVIGYAQSGDQIRLVWFKHARL